MTTTVPTLDDLDTCGTPIGDHCPRCNRCDCSATHNKARDCDGRRRDTRPLYPFSLTTKH